MTRFRKFRFYGWVAIGVINFAIAYLAVNYGETRQAEVQLILGVFCVGNAYLGEFLLGLADKKGQDAEENRR